MNLQSIASVVRQVLAVAAIVMGALTSALSSIHLPPAISSVLASIGGAILVAEHIVSNPTIGTPTTTTTTSSTFPSVAKPPG
jgi:hypothetical protein